MPGERCRKCISWSVVFYFWFRSFKTCFDILNVSFSLGTEVAVGSKHTILFFGMNFWYCRMWNFIRIVYTHTLTHVRWYFCVCQKHTIVSNNRHVAEINLLSFLGYFVLSNILWYLRFSQQCCWWFKSWGTCCCVIGWVVHYILKDSSTFQMLASIHPVTWRWIPEDFIRAEKLRHMKCVL